MWTYDQSDGKLYLNGDQYSIGYSGKNEGKNNPKLEKIKGIGPIPKGVWKINRKYDSQNTGPFTLELQACEGTDTFGRSAFRIHGDSIKNFGDASHGCIILSRSIREAIWNSGERILRVVD